MAGKIGDRCRVVAPLRPTGLIDLAGCRRDARAVGPPLDAGADAVVVGYDPFGVLVRAAADVRELHQLPNLGEPVPAADELVSLREDAARRVRADEAEDARHEAREAVGLLGLFAAAAAGLGYVLYDGPGALVGAGVVLAGAVGVTAFGAFTAGGS